MGKKIWWPIGTIVIIIAAATVYVAVDKEAGPTGSRTGTNTPINTNTGAPNEGAGLYVDYTEQNLARATGKRWLFFHAGWCPQCRAIEEDINGSGVPEGVTILKVNYDTATTLKQKYGVTLQTTFVAVDEQGNELEKFVAYNDPSLDAVVKALAD